MRFPQAGGRPGGARSPDSTKPTSTIKDLFATEGADPLDDDDDDFDVPSFLKCTVAPSGELVGRSGRGGRRNRSRSLADRVPRR